MPESFQRFWLLFLYNFSSFTADSLRCAQGKYVLITLKCLIFFWVFCCFTHKLFFLGFTCGSCRCVLGADEQYYYTDPVLFTLQHQMLMYILVYIISWIVSSCCGHGVNCGWSSSYFCCVILCRVGLLSHYVFCVLILCGIYFAMTIVHWDVRVTQDLLSNNSHNK
jgi:hypothetical protein